MNKEEMSETINELFGTEIDFTKLKQNDLKALYDILNDPERIISILISKMGIENFISVANMAIKKKIVESQPIKKLIKNLILGE